MTHLCVAIFVDDVVQAHGDAARAKDAGADMVEYRVDRMTGPDVTRAIAALAHSSPLPCIVTCRPVWEGGQSEEGDAERLRKLIAAGHCAYTDIELQTVKRHGAVWLGGTIVSAHDFEGRPPRLHNLLLELNASAAGGIRRVVKLVWTARTIRDNLEAFEILKTRQKPTIALCMGDAGMISRILAKKFGGFLTFASLESGGGTASGQISIAEMKKLYRWDAINVNTKVYGVVASPVKHSMSPAIHNAAFDATGYDGLYLPLLVEPGYESFKAFMETFVPFEGLDLSGLSVTIPHKENALRYLQSIGAQVEPLAQTIGAVNTVIIDRSGAAPKLRGMNTDYAAILDSITAKRGIAREDLKTTRVAVLGAGGTGRTAVAALAHYGADVTIYNRTQDRAEALAAEFDGNSGQVRSAALPELPQSTFDIYLNTTSVGMHPNVNESPVGDRPPKYTPQTLVFDAVYNPMKTRFIAQAEEMGAMTVGGVEMFVRQAVAQFQAWTGIEAPVVVMRGVIEERLRGR